VRTFRGAWRSRQTRSTAGHHLQQRALAEAETQYVSYLAELEAEHKKLERTQNLLKLGRGQSAGRRGSRSHTCCARIACAAALEKLKLLGASDRQMRRSTGPNRSIPTWLCLRRLAVSSRATPISVWWSTQRRNSSSLRPLDGVDYGERQRERLCRCPRRLAGQHHRCRLSRPHWMRGRVTYIHASGPSQHDRTSTPLRSRIPASSTASKCTSMEFTGSGTSGPIVPEPRAIIGERQFVFLSVKDSEGSYSLRQVDWSRSGRLLFRA